MSHTPDVRFEAGQFVAYCDDCRLASFANSQDAWNAARAAAFAPVSDPTYQAKLHTLLVQIEDAAGVTKDEPPPIPLGTFDGHRVLGLFDTDGSRSLIQFETTGGDWLYVDEIGHFSGAIGGLSIELKPGQGAAVEQFFGCTLLTRLTAFARAWIVDGGVPASPVRVEPRINDDRRDAGYGMPDGTDYTLGTGDAEVTVYFPEAPSDNAYNVPTLYTAKDDSWPLADLFTFWPAFGANITAALHAPEVQQAWQRWQQMQTIAAAVPSSLPQFARATLIQIMLDHPNDQAAQCAALRAAADRLASTL